MTLTEKHKTMLTAILKDSYARGAFLGMIANQLQVRINDCIVSDEKKKEIVEGLICDALLVREFAEQLAK